MPAPASTPSMRLEKISDLLLFRLNRLSAHAGAMVIRLCEGGHGITRREWGVIGHLYEQGPLTPSALADHFQLDRARTSRMISSLVGKGLVRREVVPGNRRQAVLRLAPPGAAVYESLRPQVLAINRKLLEVLSSQEQQELDDFIERLQSATTALRREMEDQLPKTQRRLGRDRP